MELAEQILADLKEAMLAKDSSASNTLRMLKSELKYSEIAAGNPLNPEQTQQVIRREVKKRTEAAEIFRKANNPARAEVELSEAALLQKYLPAQTEPALVENYIQTLLKENPAAQKGEIIRQTLAHFKGQTDGRTVSDLLSKLQA